MLPAAARLSGEQAQQAKNSCEGDSLRLSGGWNKLQCSGLKLQLNPTFLMLVDERLID